MLHDKYFARAHHTNRQEYKGHTVHTIEEHSQVKGANDKRPVKDVQAISID